MQVLWKLSCDYFISLIKIGKKIVCCKQAGGVGEVVIWGGERTEWESEGTGGVRYTSQVASKVPGQECKV